MTAGSYCYIGPQGIVHGTTVLIFCLDGNGISFKSWFLNFYLIYLCFLTISSNVKIYINTVLLAQLDQGLELKPIWEYTVQGQNF